MKIPNAPSWGSVFIFGAVANAVQQCWWGVGVCLTLTLLAFLPRLVP